jgi:hypothetical protein
MYKCVLALALLVTIPLYGQQAAQPVEKTGKIEATTILKQSSDQEAVATKSEIGKLYQRIRTIQENARQEINNVMRENENAESMSREEIQKRIEEIKLKEELEVLRIKKEIAQLRGNRVRVAEIEKAIDRLEHPERYRPEIKPVSRTSRRGAKTSTPSDKSTPAKKAGAISK